jgi:hypothetical protein
MEVSYKKAGGPAFPKPPGFEPSGMTLRDWFAGQALAGLCGNSGGPFQHSELSGWEIVNCDVNYIAKECYGLADAMLAARTPQVTTEAGNG